jgi:hypothetical protein
MNVAQSHILSRFQYFAVRAVACFVLCSGSFAHAAVPLPLWNDGAAKKAILEFVAAVTDENGKDYVKPVWSKYSAQL